MQSFTLYAILMIEHNNRRNAGFCLQLRLIKMKRHTLKRNMLLCLAALLLAGCSDGGDERTATPASNVVIRQAGGPRLTRLEFLAADNPGLLVGDVVCTIVGDSVAECWVPHVMAGKRLVPRFTIEGTDSTVQQARLMAGDTSIESSRTAVDFTSPVTLTLTPADDGQPWKKDYTVLVHAFTGLPVLWVETEGRAAVESKEDYVRATFRLVEDVVTRAPSDVLQIEGQIRGRGNTTWALPKKPYKMKLDAKASLLGMPADKSWVLLANYTDKTMLRNALALRMAAIDGRGYAPRSHFVELMLNGRYEGTYQLCEKVELSRHRVDVGGDGFLLEADAKAKGDPDARLFYVRHIEAPINVKEPGVDYGDEDFAYVRDFVTKADSVLFSEGFTDPVDGWRKYMDMDSFVDWYLVNEIARNNDAIMFSSCYMHLPRGGRLRMGPVWDFDIAFGNVSYNGNYEPEGFWVRRQAWFDRMFWDPAFRARVKERFAFLHSRLDDILDGINADAAYLRRSAQENENRWGTLYEKTWPNRDVWGCYENEVQCMKQWLTRRMDWLREEFGKM